MQSSRRAKRIVCRIPILQSWATLSPPPLYPQADRPEQLVGRLVVWLSPARPPILVWRSAQVGDRGSITFGGY